MMFSDEEMLMLSGIQHYRFCPRQWALIHIEQQWDENRLTIEGSILHRHVDDPYYRQKCGNNIKLRSVNVASKLLGFYGVADIVELIPTTDSDPNGICHPKYPGKWQITPIEYKRGRPKRNNVDELQLVAQAMCLEEMYGVHISKAQFYYGEISHRIDVELTPEIRAITCNCIAEMHKIYSAGIMPKAKKARHCANCSLLNHCLPELENCTKVETYLRQNLY